MALCFEENSGREITLQSIKFTISAFVRYFFKDVSGKRPSLAAIVSIKAFNASHLPLMKRFPRKVAKNLIECNLVLSATQQQFVFFFLKEKSHDYGGVIVFEKFRFYNVSVHAKTQSQRFQIPPVWKAFLGWSSMDGRPNRRNKAVFVRRGVDDD